MRKGISGIIHQKRGVLLWDESNSHTKLLEHFNLKDDKPVEFRQFVKFELWPTAELTSLKTTDWDFVLDEDIKPDWFIESDWVSKCKAKAKKIIRNWIKNGCSCSIDLRGTKVTSLGKLEYVGGTLYLANTNITSLGNLSFVSGSLVLDGAKITSLGQLEFVGGALYLVGTKLTSLGQLDYVGDHLDVRDTNLKSLGKLKSVGSTLHLRNTKITSLGKLEYVGGALYLDGTKITKKQAEKVKYGSLYI